MMVATLTFVVRELQELQELAKTTLKPLEQLKKVILRNQVIGEILLMISIPMFSIQIENIEITQRSWYQRLKNILKLQ